MGDTLKKHGTSLPAGGAAEGVTALALGSRSFFSFSVYAERMVEKF